jgi:hypothetical protein
MSSTGETFNARAMRLKFTKLMLVNCSGRVSKLLINSTSGLRIDEQQRDCRKDVHQRAHGRASPLKHLRETRSDRQKRAAFLRTHPQIRTLGTKSTNAFVDQFCVFCALLCGQKIGATTYIKIGSSTHVPPACSVDNPCLSQAQNERR